MAPTYEDILKMSARLRCRLNYGPDKTGHCVVGYQYQLKDCPRIQFIERIEANGIVRLYLVDGVQIEGGIERASELVQFPPVLDAEELEALAYVPDEWTPLRAVEDVVAGCSRVSNVHEVGSPHQKAASVISRLRDKGVAEVERRCVDLDRSALPQSWYPVIRRRS